MNTVLVVRLVVSIDLVMKVGFVFAISVVVFTGIVITLVSIVVLVSVVGTVIDDDLDVTTMDVTGQVVVLYNFEVSASVGPSIN